MPLLPSIFLWSRRHRHLHLTRIAFPVLPQLHCHSKNLVDLQLHESYFSIELLTDALSGLARLRSLSLHFPSTTNHVFISSQPNQHVVLPSKLPALTRFDFRGIAEYLECLVHRLDTPCLADIEITLFDILSFDLSRLGEFINRTGMHKYHQQARILSSYREISISLMQQHEVSTCLKFRLFSALLSEQLSAMSQIFRHLSPFLINVEDLRIRAARPLSPVDSLCNGQWSGLIASFAGVKWLHFDGNGLAYIERALQKSGSRRRHKTVLVPALCKLYLPQPGFRHAPLSEAVVSFVTLRWRSGHPIGVEYERLCLPGTLFAPYFYYLLTCLEQDLHLSRSRLIMRCSPTTSF